LKLNQKPIFTNGIEWGSRGRWFKFF